MLPPSVNAYISAVSMTLGMVVNFPVFPDCWDSPCVWQQTLSCLSKCFPHSRSPLFFWLEAGHGLGHWHGGVPDRGGGQHGTHVMGNHCVWDITPAKVPLLLVFVEPESSWVLCLADKKQRGGTHLVAISKYNMRLPKTRKISNSVNQA